GLGVGLGLGFALPVCVPVAGVEVVLVCPVVEVLLLPAVFAPPEFPAPPFVPGEPTLVGEPGVEVAGSEVIGVGTSGTGLERTLATSSFKPVSDLFRYLRSEEHTSELQSRFDLVCRLLLEKKKKKYK